MATTANQWLPEETTAREIMRDFYQSADLRDILQSVEKRANADGNLTFRWYDDPNSGVRLYCLAGQSESLETAAVVELTESEKSLLLRALGKAFARLVRL